jgi:hypothetical protein
MANYNDVAGDIPDDLAEAVQLYGTMAHPEWYASESYPFHFGCEIDWSIPYIPTILDPTLEEVQGLLDKKEGQEDLEKKGKTHH